ncbi:MAG TPA: hypothetical protein VIW21_11965 [Chthoniobacterales bacterium]|jgi:hypothetical protein
MSQSDVHSTLAFVNHHAGQQIKLELIDPRFPARIYQLRINGHWAKKGPYASKTASCGNCARGGWRIERALALE